MDDKYRVLLPLVCALSLLSFPTPWAEATATAGASRRLTQSLSPSPTEVKGTPVQPSVSTTAVTSPPVVTSAPAGTTEATAQHKETGGIGRVTWHAADVNARHYEVKRVLTIDHNQEGIQRKY